MDNIKQRIYANLLLIQSVNYVAQFFYIPELHWNQKSLEP